MSGASARYSGLRTPVETSTPPRRRRRGLHILRFPASGKAQSFRRASSQNRTRFAGLRFCVGRNAQSPLNFVSGKSQGLLPKTALAPLRLLSKPNPLRWASVLCWGITQSPLNCGALRLLAKPKWVETVIGGVMFWGSGTCLICERRIWRGVSGVSRGRRAPRFR